MADGNVQLKLQVSLDTVYLGQQLAGLSSFAKKYVLNISPTIDPRNLNALTKSIQKKLTVSVNDSQLIALNERLETAKQKLTALQSADNKVVIGVSAKAAVTKKDVRKVRSDVYRSIMQSGGKILLPIGLQPISQTAVNAFKTDLQQKLGAITVNVKTNLESASVRSGAKSRADIDADVRRGLQAISEMGASRMAGGVVAGGVTEAARRESLRKSIEDLTIAQLKGVARQLEVGGVSRLRRADLINKIVADASVDMVKKYLDPQAMMRGGDRGQLQKVLDTFARGVFHMLGMDPAAMKAKRLPPGVNWPASIPERRVPIGPSSTGRALPGAAAPMMLPGTRFSDQKRLVGDILSPSLKEVLRGAANAFADSVRREMNAAVRSVNVRDLGNTLRQAIAPSRVAGLLPSAVGRIPQPYSGLAGDALSWQERAAARTAQAYMRSALRGVDVMGGGGGRPPNVYSHAYRWPRSGESSAIVPAAPAGQMVLGRRRTEQPPRKFPSDGMMGPGSAKSQWEAAIRGAQEAMEGFQQGSIPFIGGLKSIAVEFAQATKQVLLYGTAYKGLAFIISLPRQIFNAAKAQQQYNNSLKVVTEGTGTYAKELLYVDQIQRTFGLDLEATRKGFTDLYASMAPTGFDSGSIEKLFTGISAASAALQLTPATMDRVIYAFAQMASKGQIMSEELKRQLGDALPGALGIFASAAGMSLQEFNKAMEAGEFTGAKFRETIAKVTDELIERFGTGAQAAGRSLQGLTNTIKGDFIRTLESLAPVVDSVAQATLIPLSTALKQFSSAASIAMGGMERLQDQIGKQKELLGELRVSGVDEKEIKKAEVALLALQSQYDQLKIALEDPAVKQQSENIKAFVKELQQLGTIVLNVSQAIGSVLNPVLTFFGTNLSQVAVVITSVILGFNAMRLAIQVAAFALTMFNKIKLASDIGDKIKLLQIAFQVLGAKISMATLSTVKFGLALKALLISTGIGAVVVGLGLLAAGFASVGNSARRAAEEAKASIQSIREAAASGSVALIEMKETEAKVNVAGIDAALKNLEDADTTRSKRGGQRLVTVTEEQAAEYRALGVDIKPGQRAVSSISTALETARKGQADVLQSAALEKPIAEARRKALGLEVPQPGEFPDEAAGADAAATRAQSLESYYSLQDQLAKAQTQADIDYINALFDHRKNLINSVYDLEEARANSLQKEALAHQRAVSNIFLDLQKRQIDARLEVIKAEGSVARQMAGGGTSVIGATGLLQGSTGVSSGPHFDVRRQDGAYISPEQARALFAPGVRSQLATTSTYGPRSAPVPGASTFHRGVDLAGPANTPLILAEGFSMTGAGEKGGLGFTAFIRGPQGEMYDVGHLQRPAAGAGAPRQVPSSERRDELAAQQAAIAKQKEGLEITRAQAEAQRALVVETERYLEQIFGIAENQLQTGMLAKKTALLRAGATEQEIEDAMALDRLNLKYAAGVEAANNQIAFNTKLKEENLISQEELNKRNAYQNFLIKNLNEELPKATKAQLNANEAAKEYKFTGLITTLQDEIKLLLVANDVERERLRIRQEFSNLTPEQQLQIINLEEIKKKIQEIRATIDDFVSSTVSDYKGFFKSVLFGEDPVEALKEFQKRLADKTLTLFLDFAMAPVEQFFKENLFNLFKPEESKEVSAATSNTNALDKNTLAIDANTKAMGGTPSAPTAGTNKPALEALQVLPYSQQIDASQNQAIANQEAMQEASAEFNQAVGDVASTTEKQASDIDAASRTWQQSLGATVQAVGMAAGAIMSIAGGVSQIKQGGASNVLGGIGSIFMGIGGALGGFGKLGGLFGGGGGGVSAPTLSGLPQSSVAMGFAANGAVWKGGFTPFANGGVVNGPTLGLVGEGKYNEAIVPLPDGRSIPVKMAGSTSPREAMQTGGMASPAASVLSLSFETTNIGGVEYVSRDQLELAMAATRKEAARDGANRGMSMTLDKIKNSPSTRNSLGIRSR